MPEDLNKLFGIQSEQPTLQPDEQEYVDVFGSLPESDEEYFDLFGRKRQGSVKSETYQPLTQEQKTWEPNTRPWETEKQTEVKPPLSTRQATEDETKSFVSNAKLAGERVSSMEPLQVPEVKVQNKPIEQTFNEAQVIQAQEQKIKDEELAQKQKELSEVRKEYEALLLKPNKTEADIYHLNEMNPRNREAYIQKKKNVQDLLLKTAASEEGIISPRAVTKGILGLGKSLANTPAFVGDFINTFGTDIANLTGASYYLNKGQNLNYPSKFIEGENKVSDLFDQAIKETDDQLKLIYSNYGEGATDLYKKGDYAGAVQSIINGAVESLPSTLYVMGLSAVQPEIGIPLGISTFAAGKYKDIQEIAPDMNQSEQLSVAALNGSFEYIFESWLGAGATADALQSLVKQVGPAESKGIIKSIFSNKWSEVVGKTPYLAPVGEYAEEWGTSIAQDLVDKYSGLNPSLTLDKIFERANEAGMTGLFMGAGMSTPALLVAKNKGRTIEDDVRAKIAPMINKQTGQLHPVTTINDENVFVIDEKDGISSVYNPATGTIELIPNIKINQEKSGDILDPEELVNSTIETSLQVESELIGTPVNIDGADYVVNSIDGDNVTLFPEYPNGEIIETTMEDVISRVSSANMNAQAATLNAIQNPEQAPIVADNQTITAENQVPDTGNMVQPEPIPTWEIGKKQFTMQPQDDGSVLIPFENGKDETKTIQGEVDESQFDVVPITEEVPIPNVPAFAKKKTQTIIKGVRIVPKSNQVEQTATINQNEIETQNQAETGEQTGLLEQNTEVEQTPVEKAFGISPEIEAPQESPLVSNKADGLNINKDIQTKINRSLAAQKRTNPIGVAKEVLPLLKLQPESFEQALLQYLLSGGRVDKDQFIRYSGLNGKDLNPFFGILKTGGQQIDTLNEVVDTFGRYEDAGGMDLINDTIEIITSNPGKRAMGERLNQLFNAGIEIVPFGEQAQAEQDAINDDSETNITPESDEIMEMVDNTDDAFWIDVIQNKKTDEEVDAFFGFESKKDIPLQYEQQSENIPTAKVPDNLGETEGSKETSGTEEIAPAKLDEKLAQIQAEESRVNTNPTEAQKESGNYKKGHISIQGLEITIENPKGSIRSGTDRNGNDWQIELQNTYGYFKGTEGKDKDHVDLFLGDNPLSEKVWIVDQVDSETGKFDEHKIMLGFDNEQVAKESYLSNYQPNWKGLGAITEMPIQEFKDWIFSGKVESPVGNINQSVEANEIVKLAINDISTVDGKSYTDREGGFQSITVKIVPDKTGGYLTLVDKNGKPGVRPMWINSNDILENINSGEWVETKKETRPVFPGELLNQEADVMFSIEQSYDEKLANLTDLQKRKVEERTKELTQKITSLGREVGKAKTALQNKKNELSTRVTSQGDLFGTTEKKPEQVSMFDVKQDISKENIDSVLDPFKADLKNKSDELQKLVTKRDQIIDEIIKAEQAQGEIMFSIPQEENNLVALHNISPSQIISADERGGLITPSLAIVKKGEKFSDFGGITLVGNKNMIDPEFDNVKVFKGDVYSPTVPRPRFEIDKRGYDSWAAKVMKKAYTGYRDIANKIANAVEDFSPLRKDLEVNDIGSIISNSRTNNDLKLIYLVENDIPITIPMVGEKVKVMPNMYIDNLTPEEELRAKELLSKFYKETENSSSDLTKETRDDVYNFGKNIAYRYYKDTYAKLGEQESEMYAKNLTDGLENKINYHFFTDSLNRYLRGEKHLDSQKIDTEISDAFNKNVSEEDFTNWATEKLNSFQGRKYFEKGGKKIPYTTENLIDATIGRTRAQEKGMTYGMNKAKASAVKQLKNIDQIRKAQKDLVSKEEMTKLEKEMQDEYFKIADLIKYKYSNQWGRLDDFGKSLADYFKGNSSGTALRRNGFNPSDYDAETFKEFADKLKNSPIDYLEAKTQRLVKLSEFSNAVVPESTTQDIIDVLNKNNVSVSTYKTDEERAEIIKKLADENPDVGFAIQQETLPDTNKTELQSFYDAIGRGAPVKVVSTKEELLEDYKASGGTSNFVITRIEMMTRFNGLHLSDINKVYIMEGVKNKEELWIHENGVHQGSKLVLPSRSDRVNLFVKIFNSVGENKIRFSMPFEYTFESDPNRAEEYLAFKAMVRFNNGEINIDDYYTQDEVLALNEQKTISEDEINKLINTFVRNSFNYQEYDTSGSKSKRPEERRNDDDIRGAFERRIRQISPVAQRRGGTIRGLREGNFPGSFLVEKPEVQYNKDQTKTPEFKKWFDDSKVVDENGEPLVVYHGTGADISVFNKKKAHDKEGRMARVGLGKDKFYFTTSAETASSWAERSIERGQWAGKSIKGSKYGSGMNPNIIPVYLSIKNPISVSDYYDKLESKLPISDYLYGKVPVNIRDKAIKELDKELKKEGYDGIFESDNPQIAVFEPTQIKSAIGNNGNFDPTNPDIRFNIPTEPPPPSGPKFPGEALTPKNELVFKPMKQGRIDELKEKYQDRMVSVDNLQKNEGLKVTESSDIYKIENLSTSRANNRVDDFNDNYYLPIIETISEIEKTGTDEKATARYLKAKHAVNDRNPYFRSKGKSGDNFSGVSDEEAEAIVKEYEAVVPDKLTNKLWEQINKATEYTLKKYVEYGFLTKKQYDDIKARNWKYYVPLRGFELTENEKALYDEFIDVAKGKTLSPLKVAKGRESEPDDPIPYIASMAHSTIAMGEKNRIKQAAIRLVMNNKERGDLFYIKKVYRVYTNPEDPSEYFETFERPENPYKILDENGNQIAEINSMADAKKYLEENEDAKEISVNFKELKNENEKLVKERKLFNQREVEAVINGEKYVAVFGDPNVAQAINNTQLSDNMRGFIYTVQQSGMGKFTRWAAQNFTAKSPYFIAPNAIRDVTYASIAMQLKHGVNPAEYMAKYIPESIGTIRRSFKNEPGTSKRQKELDKYYKEFKGYGGQTGYIHLQDIEQLRSDLEKQIRKINGNKNAMDYTSQIFSVITGGKLLDKAALLSENMSRFATFAAMRDAGKSPTDAAYAAKEITTNFNRKGTLSPLFGATYAFFNASIQGGNNAYIIAKEHKKSMLAVTAGFYAMGILNAYLASLWDDDERYKNISDYVKQTNIIIPNVGYGKDPYIAIPLPMFFRQFFAAGVLSMQLHGNEKTPGQFAGEVASNAFESMSPVNPVGFVNKENPSGVGDIIRPFTPTVLVPALDIAMNEDYAAKKIVKTPFTKELEQKMAYNQRYGKGVSPAISTVTDLIYKAIGGDKETGLKAYYKVNPETGKIEPKRINPYIDYMSNPAVAEHILEYYTGGRGKFFSDLIKLTGEVIDGVERSKDSGIKEAIKEFDSNAVPILDRFNRSQYDDKSYRILKDFYKDGEMLKDFKDMKDAYLEKKDTINIPKFAQLSGDKELQEQLKAFEGALERVTNTTKLIRKMEEQKQDSLVRQLKDTRDIMIREYFNTKPNDTGSQEN